MAQYGYAYRSAQISSYNTSNVRNIETGAKPFAPYVPKFSNGNGYSDGFVTKKKVIPVASRPYYEDESDDDDDEGKHPHQTSPRKFDDFLTKVHNEANRSPPRSSGHVTSPDWRHSSQPKPSYDGSNMEEGNRPLYGGNTKNFDSPRKGIQLTKATNNVPLLMTGAVMLPKPHEYDNNPFGSRPAPPAARPYNRTMYPVNETEGLKNIVTGGGAPMRQRFNFVDGGKRPDYDYVNRQGCGVLNHKEALKK